MAKQINLELEIGANFSAAITLDTTQTGRTHRADIRVTVGDVTVKVAFRTSPSSGQGAIALAGDTVTLTAGADITELLSLSTDSAFWVVDIESIGATAADVRREARGLVLVTRDITRLSEPTAAANASELLTYSLTDGQTLTTDQKTLVRTKIGAGTGGATDAVLYTAQTLTAPQQAQALTNQGVTAAGQAVAQSADAAAQRTAMGLGTLATQNGTFSGTSSGTNTGDQTNISGNAATVTTNANLTGHVTSTGNAAVLGSFTLAQLNTAISDADVGGGMAIGGAITGATASRILTTDTSSQLATSTAWQFGDLAFGAGMASRQTLRGTSGADGFVANIPGGLFFGREDSGVGAFIGAYSFSGIVLPVGAKLGFANNPNEHRTADATIERHDANIVTGAALKMRTSTVAGLAALDAATWIDTQVICTDEAGGRVPVFSDGTNWRRVTDRAIAS
jgi:hypothetical protein